MTEKIPPHVILDLLPAYLVNEVSDETRVLIEAHLKSDPHLAVLAEQAKHAASLREIPAPLKKENEMDALKKIRKLMVQHHVFLGLAVLTTFLSGIAFITLRDEDPLAPFVMVGMAGIFWFAFFKVNKQIGD